MYDWPTAGTLVLGCVAVLYIGRRALWSRVSYPLPPGPLGLPWIGNVIGVDIGAPWKTYAEWARTYGDIVYSRMFGSEVIIINSERAAKNLLEKRSGNYSDRPFFITLKMCGLGFNTVDLRYGDLWRLHRRFFHQTFRLDAVPRFWSIQHQKACHFLRKLLHTPEQLDDHVFEYTASIVLNSVYDYDPTSRNDEVIEIMRNLLKIVVPAARPDIAIIASGFPLVFRLPSWFPGMSFKRQMELANAFVKQYLKLPFEHSLQRVPSRSAAPSMVYDALRAMEEKANLPTDSWLVALREASGTAFLAASETSHSALMTFFLMMVLNPAVQEKAQAQIDDVVGNDRLPTMDDRPFLPLIDAILWETLRYCPVLPLSVPHAATEDDVYDGYHIPEGAILLTNLWAMTRDESRFPNPHTFIPERFLNDDGSLKPNDIDHIAYGFGRRICVGRHFADASVWGVIAKVLALFKLLKPLDGNGVEIQVEERFSTGITVHPLPFGYRITPRDQGMDAEKLEQLIAASGA